MHFSLLSRFVQRMLGSNLPSIHHTKGFHVDTSFHTHSLTSMFEGGDTLSEGAKDDEINQSISILVSLEGGLDILLSPLIKNLLETKVPMHYFAPLREIDQTFL